MNVPSGVEDNDVSSPIKDASSVMKITPGTGRGIRFKPKDTGDITNTISLLVNKKAARNFKYQNLAKLCNFLTFSEILLSLF